MNPVIPAKTRQHLEWARVLDRLAEHCRGPVAQGRALALDFLGDAAALRERLARVTEGRHLIDAGLSPPLGALPDVRATVMRAARGGVLEPEELVAVGSLLESAGRCRVWFDDLVETSPVLAEIAETLPVAPDLGRDLLDSFDDHGELADSASGELAHMRTRVTGLHAGLKERVHGLLSDPEYDGLLQDDYFTIREDRYVLPIRAGHKKHVAGIVHGWSGSGQTVFIEPQAVVEANNRLKLAQAELDGEIRRILQRLSAGVGQLSGEITEAVGTLATLDLALAAGALSRELDATEPIIVISGEGEGEGETGLKLELREARHPLLILNGTDVVQNDLHLGGGRRVLVVTGPNTGGKTVALKTAGLCTLMALAGLHVPAAEGSRIPLVPGVLTDIGDEQSLDARHSTFSGHIANLRSIFAALRDGSLVLLDELVVGTDPMQGAALAQAILEALAERDALVLVTTHYESLKSLPFTDDRFRNGAMGFEPSSGVPTYQLTLDLPGASSALRTARRLGLAPSIVDRAAALAGPQQHGLEAVIGRLEAEAEQARREREAAAEARRGLETARASVEAKEERLRARIRDGLSKERDAALAEARRLRDELRHLRRSLQRPEQRKDPTFLEKQVGRVEKIIQRVVDDRSSEARAAAGPPLDPAEITPGRAVWVLSLGSDAEVVAPPDGRGRVEVRAGILTARVRVEELRAATGRATPPAKKRSAPKPRAPATTDGPPHWEDAPPQAPDNTVDLRGLRAHEAIERAEKFLDAQLGREAPIAFLIHGHGTGALKRELRAWLRDSRYVRAQRPGERREGGDGVTAVLLS